MTEIPFSRFVVVLLIGASMIGCLTCCFSCFGDVKGAYDDLATITMAGSLPPSVIGGTLMMGPGGAEPFYNTLETHPEEDGDEEEETANNGSEPLNHDVGEEQLVPNDEEANRQGIISEENTGTTNAASEANGGEFQQQQREECETNHYGLMNDGQEHQYQEITTPLFFNSAHSFNGIPGMEEPRHMKSLYRGCSILYYIGVGLVLVMVATTVYFYPKRPVYNVCNDAVAYKKIFENIMALKLDASFEILISLSNPNHLGVALDKGKGSFTFDGKPVGTFEIPPDFIGAMAITDLMLVAKVTPDKYQAAQLAAAYFRGKLVLEAEFQATVRVPAMFDMTYHLSVEDIRVDVNELSDRSLCYCPSWDESKNHTNTILFPLLYEN
jgi:hypothetical protein